ncbi:MAG TPA: ABC transporter ATP-binding protein [Thermomicrobiales bacterium]|jgi:ABC-2 type transport system ATP-binding protein|nr:ABC transporter ATP-binding protein [Thermomicrobiales bacterium]
MTEPIIQMTDMVARRDGFRFGPVTLEVEPGYVVAIVGPNGSGKSTLFHTLTDLVRPESGELRLFGATYDVDELAIRRRIGFVPERSVGMDRMTGRSLGEFAAHWYPGWEAAHYRDLLKAMEIDPDARFETLSKGLQRRLASAIALATGAELLLADEPMDAVDPFFSEHILDLYSEFMAEGDRAIVFSTHALDDVRRIADYVLLVNNGAVVGMFEKDALLEQWQVLWLDAAPIPGTPGVVRIGHGAMTRVLTRDVEATRSSLAVQGRSVVRAATPELNEILGELLQTPAREGAAVN